MNSYSILTDAAFDLSLKMTKDWDVTVLPMNVTMGEQSFEQHPDGRGMSNKEFYNRLRNGESASTAAVSPGAWKDAMEESLKKGMDVLALPFSSGLSITYTNALIAKLELADLYPGRKVEVVSTLSATIGGAIYIRRAFKNRLNGMDMAENWAELESMASHVCHYFTVEDLGHLHRGGRISAATAVVGTALGIKPVLRVDDEGHLVSAGKARGRKKSLDSLLGYMDELIIPEGLEYVTLSHGDCEDEALRFADGIKSRFGVKKLAVQCIGPVIGAHSGPGTIALFFLGKHR